MRAGRLRHRLVLQSKSTAQDAYGEAVVSWVTAATVWGAIEPLSGRELFNQDQIQAEAKVRIVIRYRNSIDESYRIKHTDYRTSPGTVRYYDIVNVTDHDMKHHMMTLLCREGVSEDQ